MNTPPTKSKDLLAAMTAVHGKLGVTEQKRVKLWSELIELIDKRIRMKKSSRIELKAMIEQYRFLSSELLSLRQDYLQLSNEHSIIIAKKNIKPSKGQYEEKLNAVKEKLQRTPS